MGWQLAAMTREAGLCLLSIITFPKRLQHSSMVKVSLVMGVFCEEVFGVERTKGGGGMGGRSTLTGPSPCAATSKHGWM